MFDFVREAGWAIWPVFVFGAVSVGAAARHAARPNPELLTWVVGGGVATLLMGCLGTVAGVQASVRYLHRVADADRWIFLEGLREALNCMSTAFLLTCVATMLATVGHHRSRRRSAIARPVAAEHY